MIIQLVSGAVGGNVVGSLLKNSSLETLWNSIVGILGGAAAALTGMDLSSILGSVAGGGFGGGIVMAIIGLIKKAMNK